MEGRKVRTILLTFVIMAALVIVPVGKADAANTITTSAGTLVAEDVTVTYDGKMHYPKIDFTPSEGVTDYTLIYYLEDDKVKQLQGEMNSYIFASLFNKDLTEEQKAEYRAKADEKEREYKEYLETIKVSQLPGYTEAGTYKVYVLLTANGTTTVSSTLTIESAGGSGGGTGGNSGTGSSDPSENTPLPTAPSVTPAPTDSPSVSPSTATEPTATATATPSAGPTTMPGTENTPLPTAPSVTPAPTDSPSVSPSATTEPTATATAAPSAESTTTPGAETPFVSASPSATSVGKVASIKLTQKKQTVTASWGKVTGAVGYQIWYSTSKKWNGKKQKSVRENKVTVKNLKKKKTYYFRVRAYRLEGTKKVYGGWSKTKKITVKK